MRLQPLSLTVAASVTYGCSLCHLRLQTSIALVDALPQELLHLTLEDLEYSTVCFGRYKDAQGTDQARVP